MVDTATATHTTKEVAMQHRQVSAIAQAPELVQLRRPNPNPLLAHARLPGMIVGAAVAAAEVPVARLCRTAVRLRRAMVPFHRPML